MSDHKEFSLVYSSDYGGYMATGSEKDEGQFDVIDKKAYDDQGKKLKDIMEVVHRFASRYCGCEEEIESDGQKIQHICEWHQMLREVE